RRADRQWNTDRLPNRTAGSRRSASWHEPAGDRRIGAHGGSRSLALSDGRWRARRPVAQARCPLVESGRSTPCRPVDESCRKIPGCAMTLLTEATDVFAAAETGGRCLVAFAAKRQPLANGVFGNDQARWLKNLLQT